MKLTVHAVEKLLTPDVILNQLSPKYKLNV